MNPANPRWQVGQRVTHGPSPIVHTITRIHEDEWLGEPFYMLVLRSPTGFVQEVIDTYCKPAPEEDAATEEVAR